MGNSEDIARKHYYQVTDAHFAAAVGEPAAPDAVQSAAAPTVRRDPTTADAPQHAPRRNAQSNALGTQKATQHTAAPKRTEPTDATEYPGVERLMRVYAELCGSLRNTSADGVGFALPP